MLSELDARHIPALEAWAQVPFRNEAEWLEAIAHPECSNPANPVYRISVQAKLRLPFVDDVQRRTILRGKSASVSVDPDEGYGFQRKE